MITLKSLQDKLGVFTNTRLLEQALTHKSVNPHAQNRGEIHNERLEFLGDSVLDLVLSDLLMFEFPQNTEGELTKKRANLVNEASLSELACQLGIDQLLRVGKSEREILQNPRILASALEAVVGALYLDQGFQVCYMTVANLFSEKIQKLQNSAFDNDYKTRLQEIMQKSHQAVPEYALVGATGPEHQKIFEVEVKIKGEPLARSSGKSKKQAEQAAAQKALEALL